MPVIEWSNLLCTGVGEIDAQHRVLVDLLNRLGNAGETAAARTLEKEVLDQLVQYTTYHFAFEERLMREHAYAKMDAHIQSHHDLLEQVMARMARHQSSDGADTIDLMIFLRDWLVNHIMGADRLLGSALNAIGVR